MPNKQSTDVLLSGLDIPPAHRARAARVVASAAVDAGECATLLEMLGLGPVEDLRADVVS